MRLLKQLKSSYNKRSGLPKGFTEVEYLESNANAYIRTNIYPTDEYGYKIFNTYTIGGGEQCAIGCMDSGKRFVGIYTSGTTSISCGWGDFVNYIGTHEWTNDTIWNVECNYKNNRIITVNSVSKDISDIHISGTISRPLVLFGRDSGSITGMKGKIYKVVITKGTDIVNIFIPCLDSENVPCMYDTVNHQAYYNVGSGDFSYGKKIYGIEYLESNSTNARISTGVLLDTFPFTVKTSVSSNAEYNSFYQVIVGTTNSTNQYLIGFKSGDPDFTMKYNNVAKTVGVVPVANKKYDVSTTLTATTMVMNIDGTDYSYSESLTANGEEIGLFPQNYNSSLMRIYSTQIIKNNILVADFYPVKDENNIGYMYDKVTHRLFANAGTGSFVLGSDAEQWDNVSKIAFVEEYKGKLPRKYTEVEYLEATGTQWINTGLLSTANSKVDCVFGFSTMESGTANNCAIFGGRNNSTTTTFTFFKLATGNPQYFRFDFNNQITVGTANVMDWNTTSVYRFTYDGRNAISTNITTGQGDSVTRGPASTFTTSSITLFAVNTNDVTGQNMSGRIYHYWYTDGTTTIDLIPVLDETGKPCMYDRVSGNVYYNQGTGDDFNYGPKIQPVEYIEADGTQYIDTGYRPVPATTKFEFMFQCDDVTDNTFMFGSRTDTSATSQYTCTTYKGTSRIRQDWAGLSDFFTGITTTDKYLYTAYNNTIKLNDTTVTGTISRSTTRLDYNFLLFTVNTGGTVDSRMYVGKVYYAKLWDDGVLVRDYIPVIDENKVAFMFDRVNHVLYKNAGTGSFTYGNVVRQYTLRLLKDYNDVPTTYKRVNYLECVDNQYIDTGIYRTSDGLSTGDDLTSFSFKGIVEYTALGTRRLMGDSGSHNGFWGIAANNKFETGSVSSYTASTNTKYQIDYLATATDLTLIVKLMDGTEAVNYSRSATVPTKVTNATFDIFALGGNFINAGTRVYAYQILIDEKVKGDFVPVIRKSDNKPGMWDKVTRTFYTNAGSGEFNYGE